MFAHREWYRFLLYSQITDISSTTTTHSTTALSPQALPAPNYILTHTTGDCYEVTTLHPLHVTVSERSIQAHTHSQTPFQGISTTYSLRALRLSGSLCNANMRKTAIHTGTYGNQCGFMCTQASVHTRRRTQGARRRPSMQQSAHMQTCTHTTHRVWNPQDHSTTLVSLSRNVHSVFHPSMRMSVLPH